MEERLRYLNNAIPHRDVIQGLADRFTASPVRSGKIPVQPKQVFPHPASGIGKVRILGEKGR